VISTVTSTRFPYLSVHVRLGHPLYPDVEFEVEALVDTGFDAGLIVPSALIPQRVMPRGQQRCDLADGSSVLANVYRGSVSIGPFQPIDTFVIALPHQALLGRAVTNRYKLTFYYGRQVILEQ
jgi:clan AA aspartic protease